MRRRTLLILACLATWLLTGCARESVPSATEIDILEARVTRHEHDLDRTEAIAGALNARWGELARIYASVAELYASARHQYAQASRHHQESSQVYQDASKTWALAKARWELTTKLIIAAAALDAYNLAQSRGAGDVDLGNVDCGRVSTATFRRELKAQGVDLEGLDVDHIVPKALGGADHPLNYRLLDSSLNRSLGATWNSEKCAAAGLPMCAAAVAVSKLCGDF